MILVRKSAERGHANHGWLDTYYTFSFADYHDPNFMGFRKLRVINQDIIQPGQGFPTHSHRDMEIITIVLRGAVAHQDSMGNKTFIKAGEIQRMSAGSGVTHSEFNASATEALELLQIWIIPAEQGLTPSYQQIEYSTPDNQLQLLVSPTPTTNALTIHQDVKLWLGRLTAQKTLSYAIAEHRYAWLQIIAGELLVNGTLVAAGDGLAVEREQQLSLQAKTDCEFLVFDLS